MSFSINAMAQKAYIGAANTMAVIDLNDLSVETTYTGFYGGQVRWIEKSSDNKFIYTGTQSFQKPTKKLFKFSTTDNSLVLQKDVSSYISNLNITNDDLHLLYSYTGFIYKASTEDLTVVDSLQLSDFFSVGDLKVINDGNIVCNVFGLLYKINSNTLAKEDSLELGSSIYRISTSVDKSKIYAIQAFSKKVNIIDAATFTLDTAITISNINGDLEDAISTISGDQLLITSVGSNIGADDASLLVYDHLDYTLTKSFTQSVGGGRMSISPEENIWVPRGNSKKVLIYNPSNLDIIDSLDFGSGSTTAPFEAVFVGSPISGNEETISSTMSLYPNPTSGLISLENVDNNSFIKIYNVTGNMVYSIQSKNQIDVSFLQTGVYLLETTQNGNIVRKNFTVN